MLDLRLFFTRRFVQSEINDDQFSTLFVPIQYFSLFHWASVLSWWVLLDAEHEKMSWAELTTSFGLCYNNDPMHTTSKIRRILSGCLLQNINVDFLGGCGSVQHADTHHSSQSGLMSWIWWMLPLFRVTCPSESSSNGRKLTCCLVKSWTHRGSFKNTADSLVWVGLVEAFLHALTFEYKLFLQLRAITVHFGDDGPDAGGPGFVFFVCLCRWSLAAQEGAHVLRELRLIQQQQLQSLSAHIFALCLPHSAQTLVHNVRFLDPHVHGGPEAFGESLTSCRKL